MSNGYLYTNYHLLKLSVANCMYLLYHTLLIILENVNPSTFSQINFFENEDFTRCESMYLLLNR